MSDGVAENVLRIERNLSVSRDAQGNILTVIDPYDAAVFEVGPRDVTVTNDKGEAIETIQNALFPQNWSYNSSNTVGTKYFRRTDVPGPRGREIDMRQLAGRVAQTANRWGVEQGYFTPETGKILEDELMMSTLSQRGSFNSPVWFNLGLDSYGIKQEGETFYIGPDGKPIQVENIHAHPQISACFISSPEDSIKDMIKVAANVSSTIYKNGSGIGGDWSQVRSAGEFISGGGVASGAKRFMDVQDAVGRVIKSGGKTRRAATMQSISVWHPDMPEFIIDKYAEEEKGRILLEAGSPNHWESHTFQNLRGQNANYSVRTDDAFWQAYEADIDYPVRQVKGKEVKMVRARDLAQLMAFTAHAMGDPGIQNHTIINRWNTCKASGDIWASNPCSEYMFLNNTACNLASLNLMKYKREDGTFDITAFKKDVDVYITAQDIFVSKASYPTEEVALNSHLFRPLGLGYANLGALLTSEGLAYDSDDGRNLAAAITANMNAEAFLQSTRLAEKVGPFQEYEKNKESVLEVLRMHRDAAKSISRKNGLESLVGTAVKTYDEAIERAEKYGIRNSQLTLLAPTGTIGFMMDVDTTGGEPTFAAKSYKELSGGGYMTIVNGSIKKGLKKLKYSADQIVEIEEYIKKNDTIEGAPYLKAEHLSIFDCAVTGGKGVRSISPMGHIRMLAAIQPHVSGAISKTVNCPENTTVEEIEKMFYDSWKLGVKAVAIYRDGSKASQPLKTKKGSSIITLGRGERESLPSTRYGITQKVKLGGRPVFIRTGEYIDGRLGEVFVDSLERGSEINRLLNEAAIQFSEKLQYGMPLREALEIFSKAGKSQIGGFTDHPFVTSARGIEGFLHEWLSAHYLGDISFIEKNHLRELRPLPTELRIYQKVPKLHLFPTVGGHKVYPGAPSLEETVVKVSGKNFWIDEEDGLDTRQTLEKIKRTRKWGKDSSSEIQISGKLTGGTCDECGTMLIQDGKCTKCPHCKKGGGCGE
jgi:ribonucleoside-diphosphate reductase alpha chain